jgi:molecular chaperone DnaK (HSP70)
MPSFDANSNPVLGIDIGNSTSKVAFISDKGTVEIVQNEVTQRLNPTVVTFTDRQRVEGESAQSLMKGNFKNT